MSRGAEKLGEALAAIVRKEKGKDYQWLADSLRVSRGSIYNWIEANAVPPEQFLPLCRLLGKSPDDPEWRRTCGIPAEASLDAAARRTGDMMSFIERIEQQRQLVIARMRMAEGATACANVFDHMRHGNFLLVFTLNQTPLIFRPDDEWQLTDRATDALRDGAVICVFAPNDEAIGEISYQLGSLEIPNPSRWRDGIDTFRRVARKRLKEQGVTDACIDVALYERIGVIETRRAQLYTPFHNHCLFGQWDRDRRRVRAALRLPSGHLGGLLPYQECREHEEWLRLTAFAMVNEHLPGLKRSRNALRARTQAGWGSPDDADTLRRVEREVRFSEHLYALLANDPEEMDRYLVVEP